MTKNNCCENCTNFYKENKLYDYGQCFVTGKVMKHSETCDKHKTFVYTKEMKKADREANRFFKNRIK